MNKINAMVRSYKALPCCAHPVFIEEENELDAPVIGYCTNCQATYECEDHNWSNGICMTCGTCCQHEDVTRDTDDFKSLTGGFSRDYIACLTCDMAGTELKEAIYDTL